MGAAKNRDCRSEEERLQSLVERLRSKVYKAKASTDVVAAIEMELSRDSQLSRNEIASRSAVGDSTLKGWLEGTSSPTLRSVQKVAQALHPDGRLHDHISWIQAGREWLLSKERELESFRLERRKLAVVEAAKADLEGRWTADAILECLDRLEPLVRAKVARGLADLVQKDEAELVQEGEAGLVQEDERELVQEDERE